jgi:predicted enzyme related to lactoylglutathione lyase
MPEANTFCWNELMTSNVPACKKFYGQLFGWTAEDKPMGPGMIYTMFKQGQTMVGGMMAISPEMGPVPPNWLSYVSVPNIDATAKKVSELGGKVCVPPTDIPGIGRFAVFQDPAGAAIAAITLAGR